MTSDELADLIRQRLLGVHPDEQDVQLEDEDWETILAALAMLSGRQKAKRA